MNRNDFFKMIQDQVPVSRQMLGEVYELIDIFPYFQSAHLLLLKGLQNNADIKFDKQLKNSAIHIADREVLYYLLRTKPAPDPSAVEPAREIPEQVAIATDKEIPEPVAIATDKEIPEPLAITTETQQTVIETAMNSEQLIEEIEKEDIISLGGDSDNLQQEYPHQILVATESEDDDNPGVMLLLDEDDKTSDEKVFFMDPGFSKGEESDLLELDIEESSDENREENSEEQDINMNEAGSLPANSRKQIQSELIDRFIIANPRIEPAREKSDLPPEDISKPSVEETTSFVTETLAQIYINQGYYSKAIDIYEKLSLNFPEKSSYFATQIEKVKEYLKK
jgi:hypothetical protein